MSFLSGGANSSLPAAPAPPAAPPPPPVFGQQAPQKSQKKGPAQPTVVGAPPSAEQLGSKTLIGQ